MEFLGMASRMDNAHRGHQQHVCSSLQFQFDASDQSHWDHNMVTRCDTSTGSAVSQSGSHRAIPFRCSRESELSDSLRWRSPTCAGAGEPPGTFDIDCTVQWAKTECAERSRRCARGVPEYSQSRSRSLWECRKRRSLKIAQRSRILEPGSKSIESRTAFTARRRTAAAGRAAGTSAASAPESEASSARAACCSAGSTSVRSRHFSR